MCGNADVGITLQAWPPSSLRAPWAGWTGWYWWDDPFSGKGHWAFKGKGKSKGEGAWAKEPLDGSRMVRISNFPLLPCDFHVASWNRLSAHARRLDCTLKLRGRDQWSKGGSPSSNRLLVVYGDTHANVLSVLVQVLDEAARLGVNEDTLDLTDFWRRATLESRRRAQEARPQEACPQEEDDGQWARLQEVPRGQETCPQASEACPRRRSRSRSAGSSHSAASDVRTMRVASIRRVMGKVPQQEQVDNLPDSWCYGKKAAFSTPWCLMCGHFAERVFTEDGEIQPPRCPRTGEHKAATRQEKLELIKDFLAENNSNLLWHDKELRRRLVP